MTTRNIPKDSNDIWTKEETGSPTSTQRTHKKTPKSRENREKKERMIKELNGGGLKWIIWPISTAKDTGRDLNSARNTYGFEEDCTYKMLNRAYQNRFSGGKSQLQWQGEYIYYSMLHKLDNGINRVTKSLAQYLAIRGLKEDSHDSFTRTRWKDVERKYSNIMEVVPCSSLPSPITRSLPPPSLLVHHPPPGGGGLSVLADLGGDSTLERLRGLAQGLLGGHPGQVDVRMHPVAVGQPHSSQFRTVGRLPRSLPSRQSSWAGDRHSPCLPLGNRSPPLVGWARSGRLLRVGLHRRQSRGPGECL